MKMIKYVPAVVAILSTMVLSGCFGLEPAESPPAEPPAAPHVATPSVAKPYRTYINTVTCENMVKSLEAKEGQERLLLAVAAFMTGSNYAKGRDVNIDLKTLAIMTENYCRQNPKHGLGDALSTVDKALDRAQGQQQVAPAPVPAPAPKVAPAAAVAPATAPAPRVAPAAAAPKASAIAQPQPAAPTSPAPATAAKPAASSAAMPKASPGGTYLVQVISTNIEADANRLVTALKGDKFPAFLERASLGSKGTWYRVVVGFYDDQVSAEKVAALLRERKYQAMVRQR